MRTEEQEALLFAQRIEERYPLSEVAQEAADVLRRFAGDRATRVRRFAEEFWEMSEVEQVQFFEQLALVIQEDAKKNGGAASLGYAQWHWMAVEMEGNQLARDMLQTMAAPLYLHTLRAADKLKGAA